MGATASTPIRRQQLRVMVPFGPTRWPGAIEKLPGGNS